MGDTAIVLPGVIAALLAAAVVVLAVLAARARRPRFDDAEVARLAAEVRAALGEAQAQALRSNSEQFLELANARLDAATTRGEDQLRARKEEIDRELRGVTEAMQKVRDYVESVDKARGEDLAGLGRAVADLSTTAGRLSQAIASGPARGQWGERMAEDILQVAGFAEGIQYRKNATLPGGSGRPDYTFLLPQGRVLHMDVKFPLASYLRYLEATEELTRQAALRAFLADVRARMREVTSRDYISPEDGTLDYVLLFIPNEQLFGFIHRHDAALVDDALASRVILCSPFTLFAVLAVVRQAVQNFNLEQQTEEIVQVLSAFEQQWGKYKEAVERVGRGLRTAQTAYDDLSIRRTRAMDRQIDRVEELRSRAGLELPVLPDVEEDEAPALPPAP